MKQSYDQGALSNVKLYYEYEEDDAEFKQHLPNPVYSRLHNDLKKEMRDKAHRLQSRRWKYIQRYADN